MPCAEPHSLICRHSLGNAGFCRRCSSQDQIGSTPNYSRGVEPHQFTSSRSLLRCTFADAECGEGARRRGVRPRRVLPEQPRLRRHPCQAQGARGRLLPSMVQTVYGPAWLQTASWEQPTRLDGVEGVAHGKQIEHPCHALGAAENELQRVLPACGQHDLHRRSQRMSVSAVARSHHSHSESVGSRTLHCRGVAQLVGIRLLVHDKVLVYRSGAYHRVEVQA